MTLPPRRRAARLGRLTAVVVLLALSAACGTPPEPLPTAPPEITGSGSAQPSGSGLPPLSTPGLPTGGVPTFPTGGVPGATVPPGATLPPGGIPGATLPPGGVPAFPTYPGGGVTTRPAPVPTTRSPTPAPKPAARCTAGPTRQQVIAVVQGRTGIPEDAELGVVAGPFCAGRWQFTEVGIDGQDIDPLQVVTTGRPAKLEVVAAGGDVCIDRVQDDAPPAVRVLACGF